MRDESFEKGRFTRAGLPVAEEYVQPSRRRAYYLVGLALSALLVGLFLADGLWGSGSLVSNGPLAQSHALFSQDCAACHLPGGEVADAGCEACHERAGPGTGMYSFATHYLYHSGDVDRSAPSSKESSCADCHREHSGRDASLVAIPDAACNSCHALGGFQTGHPEFEFAAAGRAEAANLTFPHTLHVNELVAMRGFVDIERTCLECHDPEPLGAGFEAPDFDRHCASCHDDVVHRDPAVMAELRRIRQQLYPGRELADLLSVSADVPLGEVTGLYREAIAELRASVRALRRGPDRSAAAEAEGLEGLLDEAERRLRNPYRVLDASRFSVSAADLDSSLTADQVAALRQQVEVASRDCVECHMVATATIQRVETTQRGLVRARFDHRAHVTQARCLDCHSVIPIREYAAVDREPDDVFDNAGILNLPSIATCRGCHADDQASADCVSCHLFHPDRSQWANLLRFAN
jgi:hypothetical protein